MRGLAYRRFQREKHIRRKENILRSLRQDNPPHKYNDKDLFDNLSTLNLNEGSWHPYWIVNCRGKLSKGKIHCSCGLCMAKTRNKGKRRYIHANYAPLINYKASDLRKIERLEQNMKEASF